MVLQVALGVTEIITGIGKQMGGRLRPHFLAICNPISPPLTAQMSMGSHAMSLSMNVQEILRMSLKQGNSWLISRLQVTVSGWFLGP